MDEREAMQRWVEAWKEAGPALEAIRRKVVKALDTLETIARLERAFNHEVPGVPPDPASGLVELHEWLDIRDAEGVALRNGNRLDLR